MNPKFLVEVIPTVPSDLVSVKEGARIANKTERTIWRDIRSGKLRAWGTRRCYRISVSELLAPVAVRGGVNE
jgi:helix-turn-helix protein